MSIRAQVEGLGTLEFPDGTDPSVVQETVKKQLASKGGAPGPSPDQTAGMTHETPGGQQPDLPYWDQVFLSMHDNMDERARYLEKVGGKGSVTRKTGSDGKEFLVYRDKAGMPIVVNDNGETTSAFGAETLGQTPEIGGAGGGALLGGEIGMGLGGPLGALGGGILGAGIGAAVGKGAKDVGKAAAGTFSKSPGQVAGSEYQAFLGGAVGEATGRAIGAVPKYVNGKGIVPRWISGVTAKSAAQAHKAYGAGAQPSIASSAPDMKHMRYEEALAEKLSGKYTSQDAKNKAYVAGEIVKTLKSSGMTDDMVKAVMMDMQDPNGVGEFADVGKFLQDSTKAHVESMGQSMGVGRDLAQGHIDAQINHITSQLNKNVDKQLPEDIAKQIQSAKDDFMKSAQKQYSGIDRALGDYPAVTPDNLTNVAKELVKRIPIADRQLLVKEMVQQYGKPGLSEEDAMLLDAFGMEAPKDKKLTFEQAHQLRTAFRDRVDYGKIVPKSIKEGQLASLADAIDKDMMESASDPHVAPIAKQLNETDAWYKANVRKFYDVSVKRFINQVRSGWVPNPETVVNQILPIKGQGRQTVVNNLKAVLGEPMWKRVQNEHMKMVLSSFRDDATGGLNGFDLYKRLNDREFYDSFADVHGKDQAEKLKKISYMVGVLGEKLPVNDKMAAGHFNDVIHTMEAVKRQRDEFFASNPLKVFANPEQTPEEAYRWIVEPKQETRLRAVQKQFGDQSPQMQTIRRAALVQLARFADEKTVSQAGNRAIDSALNEYSKAQLEMLFPNGMLDSIRELSDTIKFMFPFESGEIKQGMGQGLKAGSVQNKSLRARLYEVTTHAVVRYLYVHPTTVKVLLIGLKKDPAKVEKLAKILTDLTRQSVQTTIGDTGPESQPGMQ